MTEVPLALAKHNGTWVQNNFDGLVGHVGWGWDDLDQGGGAFQVGFAGGRFGNYWVENWDFTPLVGQFAVMWRVDKEDPWHVLKADLILCPVAFSPWYSHGPGKSPK